MISQLVFFLLHTQKLSGRRSKNSRRIFSALRGRNVSAIPWRLIRLYLKGPLNTFTDGNGKHYALYGSRRIVSGCLCSTKVIDPFHINFVVG